ncbi:hypothetical protein HPB50_003335 [Hyalomma asiaticum]|uniref:Uncharacterized protein n=1 Tax=Hyalomma asiaticum TaxID=266040 RepID=A0ACB7SM88_HYAAI|nr:hypothetical protein HPB50_003335 [Hyalomma asiaticum]
MAVDEQGGKPNDETEACATAACSLQPRGSPTGPPLAPSGDLGEEVAGLSRPLLDALEGTSFLSDEVSQLRDDNERLRKEHSRVAEQHVRIVASLRVEVRFLRDELTRRVAPKLGERLAKSPTAAHCEFSVKPDTAATSDTTHNTETLPPFTLPPGLQRDSKLRVVDRAETYSANVTSRRGPTLHSGDEGSDYTAMASAALAALFPPPPFLATPGTPAIPWPRWIRLFENFLLASGETDLPAPRRRALLLHCLGPEGQRIFDALPPPPTAPQLPTAETLTTDTTSTGASKDRGGVSKQDASATSHPDNDIASVSAVSYGESISDFALALRELAASCKFAEQASDNMCDQFVTGVASPQLRSRASYANSNASVTLPDEARTIDITAMRHAPFIRAGPTYRALVKLARHLQIRTLPLKIRMLVVIAARYIASRPHAPLAVEPASHAAAVATS